MSENSVKIGLWESPKYMASSTYTRSSEEIIAEIRSCEVILEDIRGNRLHKLRQEAVAEIVRLFRIFPRRYYQVWFIRVLHPKEEELYAEWCDVKVQYELERNEYHKVIVESYIKKVFLDEGIITVRTTRNDDVHLAVIENPENVLSFMKRARPADFHNGSPGNGMIYY